MRYEWRKKDVNIEELDEYVQLFFTNNDFMTGSQQKGDTIEISAIPTEASPVGEKIKVELEKTSEGFSLEIVNLRRLHDLTLAGLLSQFLGGGSLILRGVKTKERLEALEKELVQWVDNF